MLKRNDSMIIIDRFENETAVLETEDGIKHVMRCFLPEYAKEGDVLIKEGCGYFVDQYATEERRRAAAERLRRLINRND